MPARLPNPLLFSVHLFMLSWIHSPPDKRMALPLMIFSWNVLPETPPHFAQLESQARLLMLSVCPPAAATAVDRRRRLRGQLPRSCN